MNKESILQWFQAVLLPHTGGRRAVVLLDAAPIQRSEKVYTWLRKHNVEYLHIPANTTAWLQANDVTMFGPAKRSLERKDDQFLAADHNDRPTIRRAIATMAECFDRLQPKVAETFQYVASAPVSVLRNNKKDISYRNKDK